MFVWLIGFYHVFSNVSPLFLPNFSHIPRILKFEKLAILRSNTQFVKKNNFIHLSIGGPQLIFRSLLQSILWNKIRCFFSKTVGCVLGNVISCFYFWGIAFERLNSGCGALLRPCNKGKKSFHFYERALPTFTINLQCGPQLDTTIRYIK